MLSPKGTLFRNEDETRKGEKMADPTFPARRFLPSTKPFDENELYG
jgi:hypothetical protein